MYSRQFVRDSICNISASRGSRIGTCSLQSDWNRSPMFLSREKLRCYSIPRMTPSLKVTAILIHHQIVRRGRFLVQGFLHGRSQAGRPLVQVSIGNEFIAGGVGLLHFSLLEAIHVNMDAIYAMPQFQWSSCGHNAPLGSKLTFIQNSFLSELHCD